MAVSRALPALPIPLGLSSHPCSFPSFLFFPSQFQSSLFPVLFFFPLLLTPLPPSSFPVLDYPFLIIIFYLFLPLLASLCAHLLPFPTCLD